LTRDSFQTQLDDLGRELQFMGYLVQQAIHGAVTALTQQDVIGARQVIANDKEINATYSRIERSCLELLALQQPMARDLRRVASTLKVITDLERMADHAVDIARVVIRLDGGPLIKPLVDIPAMADLVLRMVEDALLAFLAQDRDRALAMIEADHQVDGLHRRVIGDLQQLMKSDSSTVEQGIQLLSVSVALERIGDHATNLGEWQIYVQTGERTELNQ